MLVGRWNLAMLSVWGVFAVIGFGAHTTVASAFGYEFRYGFGPDGTSLTAFGSATSVSVDYEDGLVYVLDRQANALFKFDLDGNPVDFGGSSPNVSGNELSGLSVGGSVGDRQVAVDSASHSIYLTGEEVSEKAKAIQAFHSNGDPSLFTAGPGAGTNEISGLFDLRGVAVDSNGNIYVSGVREGVRGNDINVYRPSGALLLESAGGAISTPSNLTVDGNGVLYALLNGVEATRYTPSEYPVTPSTTYTRGLSLVDPNPARSIAVDPLTNGLHVGELFQKEGSPVRRVAYFSEDGIPQGTYAGPGEAGELENPEGIAVGSVGQAGIEGGIAQPFVADSPEGGVPQIKIFQEEVDIAPPSVEMTTATSVTGDSAVLRGKINPNNRDTTYWFEYGQEDCDVSPCEKVPLDGASLGHGRRGVVVTRAITGLEAQTVYHYRVVAENELGSTEGSGKTFTTQSSGLGFALGDSRAWEMVSPPKKFGGTLITSEITTIQASVSGDKLVFASRGPIVERPVSNRLIDFATVLVRRTDDGEWVSEDLTPPHTAATRLEFGTPFKIFTPDLLRAEMEATDDTPLSPESSEQTPYLWNDGDPSLFTPLVNPSNVPPGTEFGPGTGGGNDPVRIEGASTDLKHVVIRSEVPLVEGAAPGSIYVWSNGELEAVSELPESEGGAVVSGTLGSGQGSVQHAVSDDGSRVFWTETDEYDAGGISLPALFLRDTVADESVRLDVVQDGASGAGLNRPAFNAASADGRVVFFTDSQQLTEDASPSGRDLYRCEIGTVEGKLGCIELTDISAPLEGSGESAEVFDQVSGLSDDGTRLYFVARGVLDVAPNEEGAVAQSKQPNLYYWEEGQGVRIIATLSIQDYGVWGGTLNSQGFASRISAAASPSGRFFTFTSENGITGYENRNESEQLTTEVFVYDAELGGGRVTCVSCNPSGGAAVGERIPGNVRDFPPDPSGLWAGRWVAATLPEATKTELFGRSLYRPRSVLDNGRVFFNAVDSLVPADSNGNWDVYQWQPVGAGSCTANTSTAAVSRSGSGCVGLLSSGTAEGDAGFLDASASGDDVFFLTRGRLSVLDTDNELDAYDARVNGITAVLAPIQECAGEACQPSVGPPSDPTPSSESFRGAETPVKCWKGQRKVQRKGRTVCVAKKKKKHGKHHKKQAGKKGRAGR